MTSPDAAAFSSSCSGLLAPTMAEAIFGSRSTHASENCERVQPASSASGLSRCTAFRTSGRSHDSINWPMVSLLARESVGTFALGRYLPDNTPCASGDQTICEIPFLTHSGMTVSSGRRQSSEYWLA